MGYNTGAESWLDSPETTAEEIRERAEKVRDKYQVLVGLGEVRMSEGYGEVEINDLEFAKDRHSAAYKKKVSDTERQIDERLAELNRSKNEGQSPESNLVGNSAGKYVPQRNTSSGIDGTTASRAQSVASSGANINKKIRDSKDMAKKMAVFVEKVSEDKSITPENFAKKLVEELGLVPHKGQPSEYIHSKKQGNETYTIRVSNHEGIARNIIINGTKTQKG